MIGFSFSYVENNLPIPEKKMVKNVKIKIENSYFLPKSFSKEMTFLTLFFFYKVFGKKVHRNQGFGQNSSGDLVHPSKYTVSMEKFQKVRFLHFPTKRTL